MNKEQQLEATDKIPSALQFIKRIAPLSETFTLKGVETMMESYALLREQRAVDVERKEWQQLVLESYIENQSAIQSAIEVERKKWIQDRCAKHGHSMHTLFNHNNGQSVIGSMKCTRCNHSEDFQYDF